MRRDPLPQIDYEPALLSALFEAGGARARRDIIPRVGEILHHRFGVPDFERRADGRMNWEYRVDWVKTKLIGDGLIAPIRVRGFWRLTEQGLLEARRGSNVRPVR